MTNDELNKYIKHYIEKDRTGRAIMLSGPWGVGKSFYIKNSLIPFLRDSNGGEHQCIVVSLYGMSDLAEISKAIYLEARVKRINPESEAGKAALLATKTVLKGLAGHFGIDLSANESGLQELYQSIDLTGKLIIFEDVERTNIGILDFFGYVNSLVEQDGVKVLLVANEEELLQYKPIAEPDPDKKNIADLLEKTGQHQVREFTEETMRYLATKEKSVGDTISFTGDLFLAVKQIIQMFSSRIMNRFDTDDCANDIVDIMFLRHSYNLRSIIFACQKASDIYDSFLEEDTYSDDFIKTIFYGIVFYSLQLHAGSKAKWVGLEHYSMELGSSKYPLFRFCFDYITEQHLDTSCFSETEKVLKKLRRYDPNKTSADPDLQTLSGYYLHTECSVRAAVERITRRLDNPDDISFNDYGRIAIGLIVVKYNLGIRIDEAKFKLLANLKELDDNKPSEDDLFMYSVGDLQEEAQSEFDKLRDDMIISLHESDGTIPDFEYLPEQAKMLEEYVCSRRNQIYLNRGFAKYLNIERLVEMFSRCTPAQMYTIRSTFLNIYRVGNAKEFLHEDKSAIEELLHGIKTTWERPDIDSVQLLHYKWFIDNLTEIISRLS